MGHARPVTASHASVSIYSLGKASISLANEYKHVEKPKRPLKQKTPLTEKHHSIAEADEVAKRTLGVNPTVCYFLV